MPLMHGPAHARWVRLARLYSRAWKTQQAASMHTNLMFSTPSSSSTATSLPFSQNCFSRRTLHSRAAAAAASSASASSASDRHSHGSVLLGQLQVVEISFPPMPAQLQAPPQQQEGSVTAMLSPSSSCSRGAASNGSHGGSALQTHHLDVATLEDDLPVLTDAQLNDPLLRQQLFASLAGGTPATAPSSRSQLQAQDGWSYKGEAPSSPPPPRSTPGARRFLVSKRLLPQLMGQVAHSTAAGGNTALPNVAAAVPQLPTSIAQMLQADGGAAAEGGGGDLVPSFALAPGSSSSFNSSSSALAAFSASLPSAPLSQLVSADAARLRARGAQSAVKPRQVYPDPTPLESDFLDAARTGDWARMEQCLLQSSEKQQSPPPPPVRLSIADPRTGATALHLLATLGADAAIEALMEYAAAHGANDSGSSSGRAPFSSLQVDARASNLATPLHWAAGGGHPSTVSLLLLAGADPRARSVTWNHTVFGRGSGQTPAHWAAESGHLDCVRELHAACPPVAAMVDEKSLTPMEVAQKAAMTGVARFLEQASQEEYVCVQLQIRWAGEKIIGGARTTR